MMEGIIEDANSKLFPANNEAEHELYTIPSSSNWFSWDDIHETERTELSEFFRGFLISRTPKIYKEYRDFIINKFREDPKRRLTFTEIRKCLIGDVSLIHKVFLFLEKWGLINYGLPTVVVVDDLVEEEGKEKIKYEEGAPSGVRVVAVPNSVKPALLTPIGRDGNREVGENGFRLPTLASYSNVFEQSEKEGKRSACGKCGEVSVSGVNESDKTQKESSLKCLKCSKNENKGEGEAVDDLKFKDSKDSGDTHEAESWTDAETLLLLESVLKHGDNWNLVAQNVQTKKISDCISKLIQLPLGDLMLSTVNGTCDYSSSNSNTSNIKQTQCTSVETHAPIKEDDPCHEKINGMETGTVEVEDPPLKKRCIDSFAGVSDSLMKQVSLLSTAVSPHVTVAASEAAIKALCEENPYAREIFQDEEDNVASISESPALANEPERVLNVETEVMEGTKSETQDATPEINSVSLALRIRKAIATAFGAAAAHAKLLADQEDREVEHLVATVIETQLKKINCKIKHFEELQLLMEKEHTQIQELNESIIEERIDVLRAVFKSGISRPKSHSFVKPVTGTVS